MRVTIVDYGMGNLFSVRRAIEVSGATDVRLATSAADLEDAERLVLPGVGAFSEGMLGLRAAGLAEPIRDYAASGKPLLGICLGAQMLASTGEEFGPHEGLGLIPGRVAKIPVSDRGQKLPFIGWTPLEGPRPAGFGGTCLRRLSEAESVYLVHSYHLEADEPGDVLATYDYDGVTVTAAVQRDNVTGVQFHPEKSSVVGLRIMQDFLAQSIL